MKRSRKKSCDAGGTPRQRSTASASPPKPPQVLTISRRWLFRLSAAILVPLLILAALEVGLRLAGYGYDPHFFVKWSIGGEDFLVQNEDFSRRFFPPETMRQPGALRMMAEKPPETIRIFVLGESAAMGDPEPAYGPARYMEVLLGQRHPEVKFEVVNVAFTAINSHVILPMARECARHDGDVWIIYMGNNEMVGPYGAVTVFGMQSPPRDWVRLSLAVQRTRIGQLGVALSRRFRKPATEAASWGGMQMFLENRVAPDSPKRERVYRNFEGNLEDMLDQGLGSGAAVILSTVAVNLRDSPPFASEANEALSDADRSRQNSLLEAARKAEVEGDDERAAVLLGEACDFDVGYAEAHYRLALCLDRLGRPEEALEHHRLARDTDALPFRADSRINDLIRQGANQNRSPRVKFLDAQAALPRQAGVRVSGSESFYEHVHFNFDGAYHLGRLWAASVEAVLPGAAAARPAGGWASRENCNRLLGLTDWNRKLVAEAVMRRLQQPPLSTQRNNAERLERLRADGEILLSRMTTNAVIEANSLFAEAIAARPDDHFLYEVYGNFLQAIGDLPGAIRQWQIAGALLPQDFLPPFQVGVMQASRGNLEEAERNLRRALAIRPSLAEGWVELGRTLGARQQWETALEAFEQAALLRPQDPMLWSYQAKVQAAMGRELEAVDLYQKAIELRPNYWEAQTALGELYARLGRIPDAIAQYQTALGLKPEQAEARMHLGVLLLGQGRRGEAIGEFEKALQIDPGNQMARDHLQRARNPAGLRQ